MDGIQDSKPLVNKKRLARGGEIRQRQSSTSKILEESRSAIGSSKEGQKSKTGRLEIYRVLQKIRL